MLSFVLPVERSLQDHWSWAPEDQSLPKNKQNQYFLYTLLTGSFLSYKCVGTYKNQLKRGGGGANLFNRQAEILTFFDNVSFSHDVTAAILVYKTMEWRPCW